MNYLRPDELANQSAIEKSKKENNLLKKGAGLGTAALGAGLASKVLPFLNELIPMDLALKGINKVAPQLSQFLNKGQSMGLNIQEGLQFIKNNLKESKTNPLQQFETSYPDVAKALQGYIQKGQSPDAAAGILKTSSSFGKKISQIEKDSGKNFIDYVLELFGPQQSSGQQPPQTQNAQQVNSQSQMQPNSQPQGQGINPELMQIMNGIKASMQNLSGNP